MPEHEGGIAPQEPSPKPSLKKKLFLPGMIGGIMLVEGIAIFTLVRMTSPEPPPAAAHEPLSPLEEIEALPPEITVVECDAINRTSGQAVVVHIALSVLVAQENAERAQKLLEKRKGSIEDRVQLVVRGADPKDLNEPGLETIRRRIRDELDKVLGEEGLILDLLIPQFLQTRTSL